MEPGSIDDVLDRLVHRLAEPGYRKRYPDETEFEIDVWPRVVSLVEETGFECLTSHTVHSDRSVEKWKLFCEEQPGPDVTALGTKNRVDIVLRNRTIGSIGIEIKCLGATGHAGKLTQGLGQVVLGLANRDRTVLVIHCGAATELQRTELRDVGNRICASSRIRLVVLP
jgi:hypothetical protein